MRVAQQIRVLLIEDDPLIASLLTDTLECHGFQVAHAVNGLTGLLAFTENPFDVVVTDLKMPVMSGKQLIRRLREDWPCLPIVVVTGFPPDGGVEELAGDDPGPTILLTKPATSTVLLSALDEVFAVEPALG